VTDFGRCIKPRTRPFQAHNRIPTLTQIARILASSTAKIQEPRIGRETGEPFG
jgi:hypothetical protein